jgi:RNA polymerase sigma-70 factor (ECF subfamily)
MTRSETIAIPSPAREAVTPLDEASFGAFYERTARGLWAYVYRLTSHAADADDIVQEAYCRLLRAKVAEDEESRRRYLYRIASNLVTDRWRRRGRDGQDIDAAADPPEGGHYAAPVVHDGAVETTFRRLAARDRALLWLAYVEEADHTEIAGALGVGSRSVRVLLFRAKRRLRALLTAKGIR